MPHLTLRGTVIRYHLYFDGSYYPQTCTIACAWVLKDDDDNTLATHVGSVSNESNNGALIAEWLACVAALADMHEFPFPVTPTALLLKGDCAAVISVVRRDQWNWGKKPTFRKVWGICRRLMGRLPFAIEVLNVPRLDNCDADRAIKRFIWGQQFHNWGVNDGCISGLANQGAGTNQAMGRRRRKAGRD